MELIVRTSSIVPTGIVAAFKDKAAKPAPHMAVNAMSFFSFHLV
jgi:hypothetical protein